MSSTLIENRYLTLV